MSELLHARYGHTLDPVRSSATRLLGTYLDNQGEELIISPEIKNFGNHTRLDYVFSYLSQGKRTSVPLPFGRIISKVIAYIKDISHMHSDSEGTLHVENNNRTYQIPFSVSIDKETQKEKIVFSKPALERRVG